MFLGLSGLLLLPSLALAQEGDADRVRLNTHSQRLWRVSDATPDSGSGVALRLDGQLLSDPLVLIDPETGEQVVVLDRAAGPILGAAVYHDRLRLGISAPLYTSSSGPELGAQGFVPGKARVAARVVLVSGGSERFGLAALGELVWPLSSSQQLLSAPELGGGGGLVADYHLGPTIWAMDVQLHRVKTSDIGVPLGSFASLGFGGLWSASERLALSAELTVDTQLDRFLGLQQATASEATFGLRYALSEQLGLRVGLGKGLSQGVGAPSTRLLAGVAYTPPAMVRDMDGDGLSDARDNCPDRAEDLDGFQDEDGCPDTDNDQDGLLDTVDSCPMEPEDVDGWRDGDGCPERERVFHLLLVDWAGRPLKVDTLDLRPLGKGDPVGASDISELDTRLDQGAWELRAQEVGFETLIQSFEVPDGQEPLEIVVQLEPAGPLGRARLVVTDPSGAPLPEYTVLLDDNPHPIAGQDGEPLLLLEPGTHSMVVQAPGRFSQVVELEIGAGQQTAIYARLAPVLASIGGDYIELTDPLSFEGVSLDAASASTVEQISELLLRHPELKLIRIEVHVAAGAGSAQDQRLSQRRADAIVAQLVSLGVPRSRLEAVGFGSSFPSTGGGPSERVNLFLETSG